MRNRIIETAKRFDADIVGFAPADRFAQDDAVFKVFSGTKTVIGLGFRVLRGSYRCIEEGTTYYQYTTMGVENLAETVMPLALINVANVIEEEGFEAIPQRYNPLIRSDADGVDPEVDFVDIFHSITAENQIDFLECAIKCGLGERSMKNTLLTSEYGPFIRYCFILTDAVLEGTEPVSVGLCDSCGECVKSCPGGCIDEKGVTDNWRCAVYYNGANGSKNPFMPPDAFADFDNRLDIINGTAKFTSEEAKEILRNIYFYPPAKHFYRTSICGRACDRACYIHLEKKGILKKGFKRPFREGEEWKLSTGQFEIGKREKEWNYTKKEST